MTKAILLAISIAVGGTSALADTANDCTDKSKPDAAIAACTSIIETGKPAISTYINRGIAHQAKGQLDNAIADYTSAIKIDPKNADAYHRRGYVYDDKREFERAIEDYTKAIEISRKSAHFYNNRGFTYQNMGDYGRAISDYTKAIELNPKYVTAYNNRGKAQIANNAFEKGIQDFTKAIELDPKFYEAYYQRGKASFDRLEYEDAVKDMTISLKLKDTIQARIFRAMAHSKLDNADAAIADFNAAGSLEQLDVPFRRKALKARAEAYIENKNINAALADYTTLAALDPEDADWDYKSAEILQEAGRDKEALEAINRAIAIAPDDTSYADLRIGLYAESKDQAIHNVDKAIADLEKKFERIAEKDAQEKAAKNNKSDAKPDEDRKVRISGHDYGYMAKLYAAKDDYINAVQWIDKHIANEGDDASQYALRDGAQYHLKARSFKQAQDYATKAAAFEDDGPGGSLQGTSSQSTHVLLAEIYAAQGDIGKGLNYLAGTWTTSLLANLGISAAVKMLPEPRNKELATHGAGMLLAMKEKIPAGDAQKYSAATVDCEVGRFLSLHDPERALTVFQGIRETFSECATQGEIGIYRRQRNIEKLLNSLNENLRRKPDGYLFLQERAEVLIAAKKFDLASIDADAMLKIDPADARGKRILALIHLARGENEKAFAISEGLLKSNPKWAPSSELAARSLLKLGRIDEGLSAAKQAVELAQSGSQRASSLHVLGQLQLAKGLKDEATATLINAASESLAYDRVAAYQYALAEAKLYSGAIDGVHTTDLTKAIGQCVATQGCTMDNDR